MTVSDDDIANMLNEELLERRVKVMFLRNAGGTWRQIAAECEVSEATVRKDYTIVCRDLNNEQPANVVARHRAVIYDIQKAMYPKMLRGDVKAATVILKALHRESNLLGLDAPTRIFADVGHVDFANEAARLITRIQQLDPATLKELQRGAPEHAYIDADVEPERVPASDQLDGEPAGGAARAAEPVDGAPAGDAQPARRDDGGERGPEVSGPDGSTEPASAPVDHDSDPSGPADAADPAPGDDPDDLDDDWSNI
jgi:hypothetical protein